MKANAVAFGLETWVASGEHREAGAIAYIGSRASLTAECKSGLQLLRESGADVAAVWTPEHGYSAEGEHGESVGDESLEGLPAYSLYGTRSAPTSDMLQSIDTIVYDLQDVGARYYTFWHVLKRTLESAHVANKTYVVCDRPNPLGAESRGNVLPMSADRDVGCWPMAMQHGLVASDCVAYWAEKHEGLRWRRGTVTNWSRTQSWADLGLTWTAPSPSLPTLEAVQAYPGSCLWEGVNVSVGRGTDMPFQWIGAPWIDGERLSISVREMESAWNAESVTATPTKAPYIDEVCSGVFFRPVGDAADPVRLAGTVISCMAQLFPNKLQFHESHFDALAGSPDVRIALGAGKPMCDIMTGWEAARTQAPLCATDVYAV